jgi:hypothetical protein
MITTNKGEKHMSKTFQFRVPCNYYYEVEASNEDEARQILFQEAGTTIDGELCFDDNAYKDAELTQTKGESK